MRVEVFYPTMSQDVELGELRKAHHGKWKARAVRMHLVVRGAGSVGLT